jgi:hypothetical protein
MPDDVPPETSRGVSGDFPVRYGKFTTREDVYFRLGARSSAIRADLRAPGVRPGSCCSYIRARARNEEDAV